MISTVLAVTGVQERGARTVLIETVLIETR
jgi:hypothetical protein